ncbi:pilus assembly PilX N-terminal domain-containing protein [Planococcus sp. A6]|uniref:pilus assembly PilX family protein n=1 Tax=Planococcus sp. A6 TaxID=2992760 RepID=UPI00237BD0B8|nr:pilus assembly PilX N-terminal domain-containing protein [Planococcus sp. A6]MDE0583197.1 pilus assembly PilX N-terminal domain-containing protein [Planococcus sp. A6]
MKKRIDALSLCKRESGYTMVTVVMLLLLFSILGMALLAITMNSMKQSSGEVKSQSAYYIAESGATLKLQEVEKAATDLAQDTSLSQVLFYRELEKAVLSASSGNQLIPEDFSNFEMQQGEQPQAKVTTELVKVNADTGSREYQIVSKGIIGGRERTVSMPLTLNYTEGGGFVMPKNLGVYAKSRMVLTNGTINGDIIMDNPAPQVLEIDGDPTVNGKVYVPLNSTGNVFKSDSKQKWWFDQKGPIVEKGGNVQEMKLPPFPQPFPSYPMMADQKISKDGNTHELITGGNINVTNYIVADVTIKLEQNVSAKVISFNSSRKLTFDVGSKDISLVVDSIAGSGHLDVKSQQGGSLTLYIRDNISIEGHLNKSRGKDLSIYIGSSVNSTKPKTLISSGYAEFNASLYAKDANIKIVGSAGFKEQLITGGSSVQVTGGASAQSDTTVIYAPDATVELVQGGRLVGAVVSNVFKLSGGATVQSTNIDLSDSPFFEETGGEPQVSVDSGAALEQ